jgi:hypothetical protein
MLTIVWYAEVAVRCERIGRIALGAFTAFGDRA